MPSVHDSFDNKEPFFITRPRLLSKLVKSLPVVTVATDVDVAYQLTVSKPAQIFNHTRVLTLH